MDLYPIIKAHNGIPAGITILSEVLKFEVPKPQNAFYCSDIIAQKIIKEKECFYRAQAHVQERNRASPPTFFYLRSIEHILTVKSLLTDFYFPFSTVAMTTGPRFSTRKAVSNLLLSPTTTSSVFAAWMYFSAAR